MAVSATVAAVSTASVALTTGAFIFGSALTHFLVSTAMGAALNALAPKPKISGTSGYRISGESGAALDHQIIYGKTRVGGIRLYDISTDINTEDNTPNQYLHRVLAFAGHEIEGYEEIYLNDKKLTLETTSDPYKVVVSPRPYGDEETKPIRIRQHLGTLTQQADSKLVAATSGKRGAWSVTDTLTNIAYIYVRLKFLPNLWPNGVPSFSAVIKGRKVYDPRTGLTQWSDNPALCVRDYLTASFGLSVAASRIDEASFITAADICDELVSGKKRYTCNGAFTTASTPADILSDLLSSMGGLLSYSQGKWRIKAAKYVTPTLSFDESDLRSGISLSTRHSRRSNFNGVKGTFKGPSTDYQPADYPAITPPEFLQADNNLPNILDLPLPFTDTAIMARRVANIALRRNREQLSFSASFGLNALKCQVGDFIYINNTRFGWVNKPFEVTNWSFGLTEGYDIQVQMTLREISPAVFNAADEAVFEVNNTDLPDPFEVPQIGLTLSQTLNTFNQSVVQTLVAEVTAQLTQNIDSVEVQYKSASETTWKIVGKGEVGLFEIFNLNDGVYDVRARAVNLLGVFGDWVTITNFGFSPFLQPPSQVQDFSVNVVGNTAHMSWTPVPDPDLSHYTVRFSPKTSGANYASAITVVEKIARPANSVTIPAKTGTYFIKAVDKLGIEGEASQTVVFTDLSNLESLNVVETTQQDPTFSGTTNDMVVTDVGGTPALVLDTTGTFDETSGDFDDATGLFDAGFSTIISSGTYDFSGYIDLGEKYVSRVSYEVDVDRLDYVNTFDLAEGLFDFREGLFDGEPNSFGDISAKVQVAFTDDDPAGTPTWSTWQDFFVSDLAARAFKFRLVATGPSGSVTPAITKLSATVDMPDRVVSGNDISFTGTQVVTFEEPFKVTPAIGVAITGMTSGQYYTITSKSRTGFTLTVYNSGGTIASNTTTLDFVAKGYGKVI